MAAGGSTTGSGPGRVAACAAPPCTRRSPPAPTSSASHGSSARSTAWSRMTAGVRVSGAELATGRRRLAARRRRPALHRPSRRSASNGRFGRHRRFGLRKHYRVQPWSDLIEVHWSPRAEIYVTPVAPDVVGLSLLGAPRTDFDETIASIPALHDRVDGVAEVSDLRGGGPFRQRATVGAQGPRAAGRGCVRLRRRDHRRGAAARLRPGARRGRCDRRRSPAGLPGRVAEGDPRLPGAHLGAGARGILTAARRHRAAGVTGRPGCMRPRWSGSRSEVSIRGACGVATQTPGG